MVSYECRVCNVIMEQEEQHKKHLKTKKHLLKVENAKLLLKQKNKHSEEEIKKIVGEMETYKIEEKKEEEKKEEVKKRVKNKIIWTLNQNKDENKNYEQIKSKLENVISRCCQLLYNNCAIVGVKAMNDIIKILVLKLLQNHFKDKNSDIWKRCEEVKEEFNINNEYYNEYVKYCKDLTELTKHDDIYDEWKSLVSDFLSNILKNIYHESDNTFNCKDENTLIDLINIIYELEINEDFINAYSTTCGDIHEAFRKYSGKKDAKELGQFFTPRKLIHLVLHGLDMKSKIEEMENPSLYDPCMGTGGFLTRVYNLGLINKENIFGCELERDTIKFAYSSIQIVTNYINLNLEKCNSLCESKILLNKLFSIIVTNPPFGTKMLYRNKKGNKNGLKEQFENNFKDNEIKDNEIKFEDIYPIEINDGACLFIQNCVYKLEENGLCIIVLPDGKIFESNSKSYVKFRKWLCSVVNINVILKVPKNTFEHTGIKTNVVIFKKNGKTDNIQFLKTNKECNEIKTIFNVNENELKQKNYSLDVSDYIEEVDERDYECKMYKLGDVCEFKNGQNITKKKMVKGDYKVIGGGQKEFGYHNKYNINENTIIISKDGAYAGYVSKYPEKIFVSNHGIYISKIYENIVNENYVYKYLKSVQSMIYELQTGVGQPGINIHQLNTLKIPVPPLNIQEEIINKLDEIETNIKTIRERNKQIEKEKEFFKLYHRYMEKRKLLKTGVVKTLGDICEIKQGSALKKKKIIDGIYKVIGGGKVIGTHNKFNRNEYEITITRVGDMTINFMKEKYFLTDNGFSIKANASQLTKFIYYYMLNNDNKFKSHYIGIGQQVISKTNLTNIEISIPSLEVQQQLIEIYKEIEEQHIKLDNDINENKLYIDKLKQLSRVMIEYYCSN